MMQTTRRAVLAGMAAAPFIPALARAETVGGITRLDPDLDAVIAADAPIEVLGTGFKWAEGPVWVKQGGYLLFSDPPNNVCHRWTAAEGVTRFLEPSGLVGPIPEGVREAGSNGLAIDAKGRLVIADSGTRAITRIDLNTKARTILADRYQGKRFSSCNDLTIARSGAIYFTDPPYGLAAGDDSPLKEIPFNGIYRLGTDGKVTLIESALRRPNGLALSPDQRTLYVALSDDRRPQIVAYTLDRTGMPEPRTPWVFHDAGLQFAAKLPGLPDGIKVAKNGHVFATAPGGVHVLTSEGRLLGIIGTGKAVANCAFGEDGKTLFLTSHDMLARVRLKIGGW